MIINIMATEESHQDQTLSKMNPKPNIEDIIHEESEDEDVLSLCDLPIHTSNSTADDHYQDSSILSSSDGQEFFEFFGGEWKDVNTTPINIFTSNPVVPTIFGGKQIPSHKPISKSKSQETPSLNKSDSVLVKSKSTSSSSRSKRNSSGKKGSDKNEGLVSKMSTFSLPVKAKLLLVLFGLPPKIPTDQMELKNDIRNRQSRHAPSTFFPSKNGEAVEGAHRRSEKGLWSLSKAASCFGGPADMKTNEDFLRDL